MPQADRNSYDIPASGDAQANFNRVASRLEALISQRDADVRAAMSDYQADGSSEAYAGKEQRWNTVATEVRSIVSVLRESLVKNDETAGTSLSRAKNAVDAI
ncbi:MAG: pore-forming ESAT-6 family protein [Naasia sp.]